MPKAKPSVSIQSDYWQEKWKANDIQFHKNVTHPLLVQYSYLFEKGKIVIPLCGKTLDMVWLAKQEHHVVGIELSSLACETFFEENHLPFEKKIVDGCPVYEGKLISIWCGDIFSIPQIAWSGMTGIYDRAALVALPESTRKPYADLLTQHIKKNKTTFTNGLLISLEYMNEGIQGPPFSVTEKEVMNLFSKIHLEKLSTSLDTHLSGRAPKFQSSNVHEKVYRLSV